MGQIKKLKVAWICHFSNQDVRNRLPLSNYRFRNQIRRLIGRQNLLMHKDFAPWVNNLIKEFEKFEDVELHVIAPHNGLKKLSYSFKMNDVHYYFFKSDKLYFIDKLIDRLLKKKQRMYRLNKFFIKQFVTRINPDLINLIGTENPYYSISILDVKEIPIYVSVQTVYTNEKWKEYDTKIKRDVFDLELRIHKKERYFGTVGRLFRDLVLRNNPSAIIFKMYYPIEKPALVRVVSKKIDFVLFAARLIKSKGVEDAIDALSLVKKQYNNVSLNLVGPFAPEYLKFIKNKIDQLDLKDNITFTDYFPVHADLHQHIVQARYAVLPNYLGIIPGTIIEAILLDIPVVTTKNTGTPFLNRDGQAVLIADIGNIEMLADCMLKLMNSPELADKLKINARAFVEKEFDNSTSAKRLVKNYRAVIDHYHHNTPIPKELLFDPNEFPVY